MENVKQELRNTKKRETTDNVSENGPHIGPRHRKNNDQNDFARVNFKYIKLETPIFDGQLDPKSFLIGFLTWTTTLPGMTCLTIEGYGLPK